VNRATSPRRAFGEALIGGPSAVHEGSKHVPNDDVGGGKRRRAAVAADEVVTELERALGLDLIAVGRIVVPASRSYAHRYGLDADDLEGEVRLRLVDRLVQGKLRLRSQKAAPKYLTRLVRNVAVDMVRQETIRHGRGRFRTVPLNEEAHAVPSEEDVGAGLDDRERAQALTSILRIYAGLEPHDRRIIDALLDHGSVSAAAAHLHLPRRTYGDRLDSVRSKIRALIRQDDAARSYFDDKKGVF
jgi:DNA-directed RNA polymerase specialized sigma24 family protein